MTEVLTVNELFAGIGAFRKALINLGIPYKVVGISEIDKFAIRSYEAMYGKTRNYGDISKTDKLDYADLWTYGFPCQDISQLGEQKGIIKGQTKSGLLFEVDRLLERAVADGTQPKYLIMENVKALVSKKFIGDFRRWLERLSSLGYETYWQVMNAADYGVPQKRERVIAVSIRKDLGEHFKFPETVPLRFTFASALEDRPDKKYYLSNEMYEFCNGWNDKCRANGWGYYFHPLDRADCAGTMSKTITTKEGASPYGNYIREQVNSGRDDAGSEMEPGVNGTRVQPGGALSDDCVGSGGITCLKFLIRQMFVGSLRENAFA